MTELSPRLPNFARLFAEAVRDTIIDQFDRSVIQTGYFLMKFHIRLRPGEFSPEVPARIYFRDHEPGDESNKLDRWPMPVLAGEILGEYCDPVLVWTGRGRRPLIAPEGYTVDRWYEYLVEDAKWAAEYAQHEPIARPRRPARLTQISPLEPPLEGRRDE